MARTDVVRDYGGVSAADRRAERRRKLLAAGRRLWGEQGPAHITVRGVCSASGLTPRYFYEHFTTRDELTMAVADEVRDELFGALVAASLSEPGGLARKLNAAFVAFFELIAADPHIHRILTSDPANVAGLAAHRSDALDRVADLVVEHGANLLDPLPSEPELRRLALFVVGGVDRLVENWLRDQRETPAQLAEICTQLCLATVNGAS